MIAARVCASVLMSASTAFAATIPVPAGGNLQAAINSAQPGDTITLQAGATYTGPFTLPAKSGEAFITIRTAGDAGLPGEGARVSPVHANAPGRRRPKAVSGRWWRTGNTSYQQPRCQNPRETGTSWNASHQLAPPSASTPG